MAMKDLTKCPTCGGKRIKKVSRDWEGVYHGKKYIVPNLTWYICPDCKEQVYDPEAMRKIERHSPVFQKKRQMRKSVV